MFTPIVISLICTLIVAFLAFKLFSSKKKQTKLPDSPVADPTADSDDPMLHRALNPEDYEDCTVYNLVNCVHCDRLKKFLQDNNLPYTPILVDNFSHENRQKVMKVLRSYNPRASFPTLVTPSGDVLVGFREWQAKALLLPDQKEETEEVKDSATLSE